MLCFRSSNARTNCEATLKLFSDFIICAAKCISHRQPGTASRDWHFLGTAAAATVVAHNLWSKSGFELRKEAALQKTIAIVFALMLVTTAGFAQIPSFGNIFVGYSYNRADTGLDNRGNLNGWEGSLEGKFLPFVGMVADVSAQYGTLRAPSGVGFGGFQGGSFDTKTRVQSYLFGPRVSFSVGKIRPFAHILIGASHLHESTSFSSNSETDFADAIGGGIDYHLIPRVSWRVQGDALQTRFHGARQDDARISTGLAVKF